jgi:hypothetical protein
MAPVLALLVAAVLAQPAPLFTGCAHRPVTRPPAIVIACGDGNFYATALRWTRWTSTDATATGLGHQNDCTPYCAAGHFHAFPIAIRLSAPVTCVRGRREFARISWRWTGAKLAGVPRSGLETLPCSFLRLKP